MKKRPYLQVCAIRLCAVGYVLNILFTCMPDFDLIWAEYSVILLFCYSSLRLWKKTLYLQAFAISSVCIKCFVYTFSACMHPLFLARVPKTMHSTISI
jgi:hypothetical protein